MVEHVESIEDPRLSGYRHVTDPAWLRVRGLFVAEGRLVVHRLVERRTFRIESLLLTPAAYAAIGPAITTEQTYVAAQAVLDQVTGIHFHRGCLAIVHRPGDGTVEPLAAGRRILALEGVANPDNVGGLFRVAAAFGVNGVLIDPATSDPFYRKAVRTSMGWTLSLPCARDPHWPSALDTLRGGGLTILALTPRASASVLGDVRLPPGGRFVLMAGAEGSGLSDAALARADLHVRIPIDAAVDSLNVTVAAGIALAVLTSGQNVSHKPPTRASV